MAEKRSSGGRSDFKDETDVGERNNPNEMEMAGEVLHLMGGEIGSIGHSAT